MKLEDIKLKPFSGDVQVIHLYPIPYVSQRDKRDILQKLLTLSVDRT